MGDSHRQGISEHVAAEQGQQLAPCPVRETSFRTLLLVNGAMCGGILRAIIEGSVPLCGTEFGISASERRCVSANLHGKVRHACKQDITRIHLAHATHMGMELVV